MNRSLKITLASLLVVMLLLATGLSMASSGLTGALGTAWQNAETAAQQINASRVSQLQNVTTQAQATPTTTTQTQAGAPMDAVGVAKMVGPAVVTVVNNLQTQGQGGDNFNPNPGTSPQALGSGLIIDSQGDIVTNNHVIANQASLTVIFSNGQQAPATVVGTDAFSDLAAIKVAVPVPAVAQFGNSDTLQPGQPVLAIGSALGDYANSVTEGIVSGLHRSISDAITGGGTASTSLRDLIQTDAAINHGNSGGPLIDIASGKVIGINTAVVRTSGTGDSTDVAEGLGFAIPSNTVQSITAQLIKSGSIVRPYLGVQYIAIDPQVAAYYNLSVQNGVYVNSVAAGSPAEKAGIQPNSVITKLNGTAIDDTNTLETLLFKYKVGDSVTLTLLPPNSTTPQDVTVVLGQRPNGQ